MADTVAYHDTALLLVNDGSRVYTQITADAAGFVRIRKLAFPATLLLGAAYGSVFELHAAGKKTTISLAADGLLLALPSINAGSGSDNRMLLDGVADVQTLSADDIRGLKQDGRSGSSIITALAEGSASFSSKTVFSQEKWLKRKAMKYMPRFRVVRPDPLNVAETALLKHADKILGLRFDALSLMLTFGDVRRGATPLVFDEASGLLLGAVAHRLGGSGTIIAPHPTGSPNMGYVSKFNLGRAKNPASEGQGGGRDAAAAAATPAAKLPPLTSSASASVAGGDSRGDAAAGEALGEPLASPPSAASSGVAAGGLRVVGVAYSSLASWARDAPAMVEALRHGAVSRALNSAPGEASLAAAAAADPLAGTDAAVALGATADNSSSSGPGAAAGEEEEAAAPVGEEEEAGDDVEPDAEGSEEDGGDSPSAAAARAASGSTSLGAPGAEGSSSSSSSSAALLASSSKGGAKGKKRGRNDGKDAPPKGPTQRSPHNISKFPADVEQQQRLLLHGADSCLIAVRGDPLPALIAAVRFLKPGSPFAAFCTDIAALTNAAQALRGAGAAINLNLSETWTRVYQVLPQRTHPMMSMHGASGFLLTGIVVACPFGVTAADVIAPPW